MVRRGIKKGGEIIEYKQRTFISDDEVEKFKRLKDEITGSETLFGKEYTSDLYSNQDKLYLDAISDLKNDINNLVNFKNEIYTKYNESNNIDEVLKSGLSAITLEIQQYIDKGNTLLTKVKGKIAGKGKPKNKKLGDCNVKELKERAKSKKVKAYSTMNKAELLAALRRK